MQDTYTSNMLVTEQPQVLIGIVNPLGNLPQINSEEKCRKIHSHPHLAGIRAQIITKLGSKPHGNHWIVRKPTAPHRYSLNTPVDKTFIDECVRLEEDYTPGVDDRANNFCFWIDGCLSGTLRISNDPDASILDGFAVVGKKGQIK